jgi:hypothetical protein
MKIEVRGKRPEVGKKRDKTALPLPVHVLLPGFFIPFWVAQRAINDSCDRGSTVTSA